MAISKMITPRDTPPTTSLVRQKNKKPAEEHEYDSEFDDEYFFRTYRPLSNLPTPPPSSRNSLAKANPLPQLMEGEALSQELLGPAIHLTNLIPPAASLSTPSVPLVHAILARAALPTDTIALAVCILDSLDSKFPMSWRLSCPLTPSLQHTLHSTTANKRHTLPAGAHVALDGHMLDDTPETQLHIDSVFPEVIILSSLVIASKFVEDHQEATSWYAGSWGSGLWSCAQINVTERCVMENLGYRILPLWNRELIVDATRDMKIAGRVALRERERTMAKHHGTTSGLGVKNKGHSRTKTCGNTTGLGLRVEDESCAWA